MPLLHCNRCHHEWEGRARSRCDWCGATAYVLEKETPLEKLMKYIFGKEEKNGNV